MSPRHRKAAGILNCEASCHDELACLGWSFRVISDSDGECALYDQTGATSLNTKVHPGLLVYFCSTVLPFYFSASTRYRVCWIFCSKNLDRLRNSSPNTKFTSGICREPSEDTTFEDEEYRGAPTSTGGVLQIAMIFDVVKMDYAMAFLKSMKFFATDEFHVHLIIPARLLLKMKESCKEYSLDCRHVPALLGRHTT